MKRSDKGRSVTRYLTGHAAIPMLSWNGDDNTITAPPPYKPYVSTDGAWWRFRHYLDERQDDTGIPFVVRYDKSIPGVDNAIVGIHLRNFATILHAHYISISDRVETYRTGE
jgi:hypothetical protein